MAKQAFISYSTQMETNFNHLLLDKDPSGKLLIDHLIQDQKRLGIAEGLLYHSFPLYKENEETSSRVNVLLLHRTIGLVIIECVKDNASASEIDAGINRLEQVYSQVFSKLIKSRTLRAKASILNFETKLILFAPNVKSTQSPTDDIIITNNFSSLDEIIAEKSAAIQQDRYQEIIAILEGSKILTKTKTRDLPDKSPDKITKGHVLEEIELALANFDIDQKRAAMNIIDGPQRIRGLAGSGKTIVLTWKAALIHLQDPDAEILYTFYTKSLYELIRNLITRFYRHFSDTDPNWNKIHVLHAWGGSSLPGVYYNTCRSNGIPPKSVSDIQGFSKNKFDIVCQEILAYDLKKRFDYSLLDEAQDFAHSFYRLCNKVTHNKRVIWGYDECQNILDVNLQDPKETFGKDKFGNPEIDLSTGGTETLNDIVLHRCYRNPKDILMYSFALGFGLYNDRILQMLENNDHWEDLGFKVEKGNSQLDEEMIISRPDENSPLTQKVNIASKTQFKAHSFKSIDEECQYVAHRISEDLKQNLLPQDILVICVDDYHGRAYFNKIELLLAEQNIDYHNMFNVPYNNTDFFRENHVTLSSIYKAKGNEAASVYIVGVDQIFSNKDSIKERNKIFTAFTRSKAWITVTGTGKSMTAFESEVALIEKNMPQFKFIMPDKRKLKTFQRDLNEQTAALNQMEKTIAELAKKSGKTIEEILDSLNSGLKKQKK